MSPTLRNLAQLGEISALSRYFGEFIVNQCNEADDAMLAYTAALISEASQRGDVCLDLNQYQSQPLFDTQSIEYGRSAVAPELAVWQQQLLSSPTVGLPGELCPLILEENRLYLYRYWYYETRLAESILDRTDTLDLTDPSGFTATLDRLYPDNQYSQQKLAVAVALRNRFAIICGGPGTGKTTTVINILTTLLEQQGDLRIALAAPTGKAAARLFDSIRQRISTGQPVVPIPDKAVTLHRLLGFSRSGAAYNHRHPLPIDCIVIDEASMVDLTLMHHLLDALHDHARIILLGDRDQLASVAAGSVLADITGRGLAAANSTHYPMADSIAILTDSYRFSGESRIGRLARLVNKGDSNAVFEMVANASDELRWQRTASDHLDSSLLDQILGQYQSVVQSESVERAFEAFDSFRVLCAVRTGPFGVEEINRVIEQNMRARGWIDNSDQFHGRAILINNNDYDTGLYNGDLGLVWKGPDDHLSACFLNGDQGIRRIAISNLPEHSPAWALTVHKSQGSEFDSVLLILPDEHQKRGLSRELLYTGITRCRSALSILAGESVLRYACDNSAQRLSGLARKLGWKD